MVFDEKLSPIKQEEDPNPVCDEAYFDNYFLGKFKSFDMMDNDDDNNAGNSKRKNKGTKGFYLFKSYKEIRCLSLHNWERIFLRPSYSVTMSAILYFNQNFPIGRIVCPKLLDKVGKNSSKYEHFFAMTGSLEGEKGNLSLQTFNDKDGKLHNPFYHFIRKSFLYFANLIESIHEMFASLNVGFPSLFPPVPLTLKTLMETDVTSFLGNILSWISTLSANEDIEENSMFGITQQFRELHAFLETSPMHVFLAAFTLWDEFGLPFIGNIIKRSVNLELFQMLLTEEFLGFFYMVCFLPI
jgi:hypothetical protein